MRIGCEFPQILVPSGRHIRGVGFLIVGGEGERKRNAHFNPEEFHIRLEQFTSRGVAGSFIQIGNDVNNSLKEVGIFYTNALLFEGAIENGVCKVSLPYWQRYMPLKWLDE